MNSMIKQLLFSVGLLWAGSMMAQQNNTVSTFSEMKGDYIIVNSKEYEGVKSIADTKAVNITLDKDSLNFSGFYMKGCPDFRAGYDEKNGSITIPAGTLIYIMFGEIYQYLFLWNDEKEEIIQEPIVYHYKGNNLWETEATLMMMVGEAGGELSPYYFSQGSKIYRSNGTTENISFSGWGQDQQRYDESRPSYLMIDNERITIFNLLQADQYGYGSRMEGTYDSTTGEVTFLPAIIGQSNEGLYRVLTGCIFDESDNKPVNTTNSETNKEGQVKAKVDMEQGILEFEPMAVWPASITERGGLVIDKTRFFEFVKTVKVTFDPQRVVSVSTPEFTSSVDKEIVKVEYYDITGQKIAEPILNSIAIQKIYYKDRTSKVQKIYIR